MSVAASIKRLSGIYRGMKDRCYNPNSKSYKRYGGRGIAICNEWLANKSSFVEWALANGYENHLTIDRRESSKGYCPENCRWITSALNSSRAAIERFQGIKTDKEAEILHYHNSMASRINKAREFKKHLPRTITCGTWQ
jgi:hypothetical protein